MIDKYHACDDKARKSFDDWFNANLNNLTRGEKFKDDETLKFFKESLRLAWESGMYMYRKACCDKGFKF